MRIYFTGSIRGGRKDQERYLKIIRRLKKYGLVFTEHVGDQNLTSFGEKFPSPKLYQRDMKWLKRSEVVIAEVSTPSLGVGYEIAVAEKMGKKILCLYRPQRGRSLSAMIAGNKNLLVVEYHHLKEAFGQIDNFLKRSFLSGKKEKLTNEQKISSNQ